MDWRWHSYLISASTVCGVALARFAPGRLAAVAVGSERDHHLSDPVRVPLDWTFRVGASACCCC